MIRSTSEIQNIFCTNINNNRDTKQQGGDVGSVTGDSQLSEPAVVTDFGSTKTQNECDDQKIREMEENVEKIKLLNKQIELRVRLGYLYTQQIEIQSKILKFNENLVYWYQELANQPLNEENIYSKISEIIKDKNALEEQIKIVNSKIEQSKTCNIL